MISAFPSHGLLKRPGDPCRDTGRSGLILRQRSMRGRPARDTPTGARPSSSWMLVGRVASFRFPARNSVRPCLVDPCRYADEVTTDSSPNPRGGNRPLSDFEEALGLPSGLAGRVPLHDAAAEDAIEWLQLSRPRRQNHWPALTLALVAQAEALLDAEGLKSVGEVFDAFPIQTSSSGQVVNTLNFTGASTYTLRPKYNAALNVIRVELRREHPSNAAHATQSWAAYRDLVGLIYRSTPSGRGAIAKWVWDHGVLPSTERVWATQLERVVRPFEYVLASFPTQGVSPGGALLQSLVFGYFRADSPNLTLESHSVNTASGRADMPGDVASKRERLLGRRSARRRARGR